MDHREERTHGGNTDRDYFEYYNILMQIKMVSAPGSVVPVIQDKSGLGFTNVHRGNQVSQLIDIPFDIFGENPQDHHFGRVPGILQKAQISLISTIAGYTEIRDSAEHQQG
jgi:hypothetical protein